MYSSVVNFGAASLTNAHVVEGCRQISVNTEGQSGAAKILASERNDLALLATDLHPNQTANWRLQVRHAETLSSIAFRWRACVGR
jgi:S1-C subfamily serine protease